MKSADFRLIDEKAALLHGLIGFRAGTEVGPEGNHQVEFVFVEVFYHPRGIGIAGFVEHRFSHGVPPEPVLHDIVGGDVQLPVFVSDAEQLLLRVVFILALPESISPSDEHRWSTVYLSVSTDSFVELRTVPKVVVQYLGDF